MQALTPLEARQRGWIAAYRAGDRDAAGLLVESMKGMVVEKAVGVTRSRIGRRCGLEDAKQEMRAAVLVAARTFDAKVGASWHQYCGVVMNRMACRAIVESAVIRLPYRMRSRASRELSRFAADVERVRSLGSLDDTGEDDRPISWSIQDRHEPVDPFAGEHEAWLASRALSAMTPKQARAVRLRFGLDGGGERTLLDVSRETGVCRKGAFMVIDRGLAKARAALLAESA
jgi:hypothetical protein